MSSEAERLVEIGRESPGLDRARHARNRMHIAARLSAAAALAAGGATVNAASGTAHSAALAAKTKVVVGVAIAVVSASVGGLYVASSFDRGSAKQHGRPIAAAAPALSQASVSAPSEPLSAAVAQSAVPAGQPLENALIDRGVMPSSAQQGGTDTSDTGKPALDMRSPRASSHGPSGVPSASPRAPQRDDANVARAASDAGVAQAGATQAPTPTSTVDTGLANDVRLLRDVQGALRQGDNERALQMLDARRAAGPDGVLGEERIAARIVTLCKLGRVVEARAEAARFLRERPSSPLAPRVRTACDGSTGHGP